MSGRQHGRRSRIYTVLKIHHDVAQSLRSRVCPYVKICASNIHNRPDRPRISSFPLKRVGRFQSLFRPEHPPEIRASCRARMRLEIVTGKSIPSAEGKRPWIVDPPRGVARAFARDFTRGIVNNYRLVLAVRREQGTANATDGR